MTIAVLEDHVPLLLQYSWSGGNLRCSAQLVSIYLYGRLRGNHSWKADRFRRRPEDMDYLDKVRKIPLAPASYGSAAGIKGNLSLE
ncbi:hypothetical protein DAEQUDRAFT_455179 [Daedalea quercina L-15889]|uniref:Uncharacterized protein n=1 Tax=Daedalea quercina L-15889 TaxID=1314783 RepID=A0A165N318_9APHY|nr:hypothetical protein DAEQUDRAFT_455179 [Daedalea quercina L-15889]